MVPDGFLRILDNVKDSGVRQSQPFVILAGPQYEREAWVCQSTKVFAGCGVKGGTGGEHRTGEDDGRSRTLDSTGSAQPIARGRSRAPPAVPAPQPVRQVRTRDATEGVAQAERGARSFRTGVQTFPSLGFLIGASVSSGALLGRTSVRLVVLQGSFSKE